jgi:hypothetical protein
MAAVSKTMVFKEPQPAPRCKAMQEMAQQGENLHHEKPPGWCDTRRILYDTEACGLQRDVCKRVNLITSYKETWNAQAA